MATGRKTGGRKKGVPNKATVEKKLRATKGIESAAESGVLPLDVMLARMRSQTIGGKNVTDDQFAAAVAAAPYPSAPVERGQHGQVGQRDPRHQRPATDGRGMGTAIWR